MFLKYAQISVFPLKYVIYGQENVRKWMLLEGKTQPGSTMWFCTLFLPAEHRYMRIFSGRIIEGQP